MVQELFYKYVPGNLYIGNIGTVPPMVSRCVTNFGHFTTLIFQCGISRMDVCDVWVFSIETYS